MPADSNAPLAFGLRIVRRHWAKMAVFFVIVTAMTVVGTLLSQKYYLSEARLFLRLGRENATLDPTTTLGQSAPVVAVPYSRESEIISVTEVLTSRYLLDRVVQSLSPEVILGLAPLPEKLEPQSSEPIDPAKQSPLWDKAVERLRRGLHVEVIKKSSVLSVSYEATSPELARTVVSRLIDLYLDRHIELNRTPGGYRFLTEQASRLQTQVRRTEEELRHRKNSTGLLSPESQRQILVTRIGRLEDELLQSRTALASAQAEVRTLGQQIDAAPRTHVTATTRGMPNQAADQMRSQLYTLQLREQELLARYPEQHPEVKNIRKQTAAARELLQKEEGDREQVTTGPNRLREEAQLALSRQQALVVAQQARVESLETQLKHERDTLQTFTSSELEIARLQRQLELEVGQYRKYAESLEQGQIDRALQAERISNVSVVQPATYERKPVRPRLLFNLAIGMGLALMGSLGIGVLAEYRRDPGSFARSPTSPAPLPGSLPS